MMCEDSVLSIACSPDSDFIAAGCRDGNIKAQSLLVDIAVFRCFDDTLHPCRCGTSTTASLCWSL